jgi:hypothetical protein
MSLKRNVTVPTGRLAIGSIVYNNVTKVGQAAGRRGDHEPHLAETRIVRGWPCEVDVAPPGAETERQV